MGRTKQRAQQRKKEKQQRRNRYILIGVVGLAALVAVAVILQNRPIQVEIPEDLLTRYDNIPQSVSDRGFPVLGNEDAVAKVVEYSSFDCSHCREFHEDVTTPLVDRLATDNVSFTYVPVYGTGGIPNGELAARSAICAGEQGSFWEYHDLLFTWQGEYVATAFTRARLRGGIEALGLDVDAYNACLNSDATDEVLDNARTAFGQVPTGSAGGVGTPSVTVNGARIGVTLSAVNEAIDQALSAQ